MISDYHYTVMKQEILDNLDSANNGTYVDATLGMGGHTLAIMESTKKPKEMICIDLDEESLKIAKKRLEKYSKSIKYIQGNFKNIDLLIKKKVDAIIADLGISGYQLLNSNRGFSFDEDSLLDMRINKHQELTAHKIVNSYNMQELSDIIKNFGEEKNHFKIASEIVRQRHNEEIKTSLNLAKIIKKINKNKTKINASTRTFQALRIAVNDELSALIEFLEKSLGVLKTGGRLIIISFHSLEDRIVKQFFKYCEIKCVCPSSVMTCECKKEQTLRILTKKPLTPSKQEVLSNTRSRSAKMRIGVAL